MKVVMVVANNFTDDVWTDPRVSKEAYALRDAGHEVVVVATAKYGRCASHDEVKDGLRILRRPTVLHRLFDAIKRLRPSARASREKRTVVYYDRGKGGFLTRLATWGLQFLYDLNNLLFASAVTSSAIRQRAEVYIGHDLNGFLPAFVAARVVGARVVYDSHELWVERARARPYSPVHRKVVEALERLLIRRADLVIAVSDSVADQLVHRYAIKRPIIVPNVHAYSTPRPTAEIRARLVDGRSGDVVVYAGYLDRGKGLEQLIAASQLLPGVVVSIIGDGVLKPALKTLVKTLGVENRVHFVGWVSPDNLADYVAAADLGVTPLQSTTLNYYYNIDNKFFHYISAGIPLACSRQPDKLRIIEQYRIGATFDESDPHDIARVIQGLLSDQTELKAMRLRCLEAAQSVFNWKQVSARYVAAIEDLQACGGPR